MGILLPKLKILLYPSTLDGMLDERADGWRTIFAHKFLTELSLPLNDLYYFVYQEFKN